MSDSLLATASCEGRRRLVMRTCMIVSYPEDQESGQGFANPVRSFVELTRINAAAVSTSHSANLELPRAGHGMGANSKAS